MRFLYERIYGVPPEEDGEGSNLWNGPEGTMTLSRHRLVIPEGSTEIVREVIRDAKRCLDEEQKIDAGYKHMGRTLSIKDGTPESNVACM